MWAMQFAYLSLKPLRLNLINWLAVDRAGRHRDIRKAATLTMLATLLCENTRRVLADYAAASALVSDGFERSRAREMFRTTKTKELEVWIDMLAPKLD